MRHAIAIAAALAALPPAASAQSRICAPRDALVAHLAEEYGERRIGAGLVRDTRIVELFVSEDGSWSILATDPRGTACLVGNGGGWETTVDEMPAGGTLG